MSGANEYFIPINEVAKRLNVPAYTLRYWEKQFPGAVRPVTGAGNRRYYRGDTIEKLETIKSLLYDKGMTIVGVKKILHNGTFKDEIKDSKKTTIQTLSPDTISSLKPKTISALDMGDIESAIKLLNQAKTFLD